MKEASYYKVKVDPAPRILGINHATGTKQFKAITTANPRSCRIRYIHSGTLIEETPEGAQRYPEGSVITYFHDHDAVLRAEGPIQIFGFTLVFFRDPVPMTAEDVAQWRPEFHEVILPHRVTDPAVLLKLADLIKEIVGNRFSQELLFSLKIRTTLHQIYLLMTEYAIRETGTWKTKAIQQESRHCLRADQYIHAHLHEKIAVADIAAATGISYNYLNRLFAAHHGMTMVEYINREKLLRVEQLLLENNLTPEAAGEQVGIHDIKYLSRLFRRYSGMTITEYLRSCGLKQAKEKKQRDV